LQFGLRLGTTEVREPGAVCRALLYCHRVVERRCGLELGVSAQERAEALEELVQLRDGRRLLTPKDQHKVPAECPLERLDDISGRSSPFQAAYFDAERGRQRSQLETGGPQGGARGRQGCHHATSVSSSGRHRG